MHNCYDNIEAFDGEYGFDHACKVCGEPFIYYDEQGNETDGTLKVVLEQRGSITFQRRLYKSGWLSEEKLAEYEDCQTLYLTKRTPDNEV